MDPPISNYASKRAVDAPNKLSMTAMNVFIKGTLEEQRRAVVDDLGHVPEIPVDMMLKLLPDVDVDVSGTMDSLRDAGAWSESCWWSDFEGRDPKDIATRKGAKVSEGDVFRRLNAVQKKIVSTTRFKEGMQRSQTLSFEQFPNHAPTSDTLMRSRPDGCGILTKDQDIHTQKVPHAPPPMDRPHWYDIGYVEEYKLRDDVASTNDNIFKILWNLHFIMSFDHRRRFAYGVTIENKKARIWFCCRQIVLVSKPFDFYKEPETFIHLVSSLAYASTTQLGYDPTMELKWRHGCFLYDITLNGTTFSGESRTTTYEVHGIISDGSHNMRGRATRIYEVQFFIDNQPLTGILKDSWIDNSRSKEGDVLIRLLDGATREEQKLFLTLRHHGVVGIDGQDESTEDLILKGQKFASTLLEDDVIPVNKAMWDGFSEQDNLSSLANQMDNLNTHEPEPHIVDYYPLYQEPPTASAKFESVPESSTVNSLPHLTPIRLREPVLCSPKVHYRIVYDEIGESLLSVAKSTKLTAATVFRALIDICSALEFMARKGFVHRDVSAGNIILYKDRAKLSDLEFAKEYEVDRKPFVRTGTYYFMAGEVAHGLYSFTGTTVTHNIIHDLESLWWIGVWCFMLHYPVSKTRQLNEAQKNHSKVMAGYGKILFPVNHSEGITYRLREVNNPGYYDARSLGYDEPMQALLISMDHFRQCILWAYMRIEQGLPRPATYFSDVLRLSDPREVPPFTENDEIVRDINPEDDHKRRPVFELVRTILKEQHQACAISDQRLWPLGSLEQHSECIRQKTDDAPVAVDQEGSTFDTF